MQLTLSPTPFAKRPAAPQPAPQPARQRDTAARSQLDQIAAQNLQASRQGLGTSAMLLALVGGLVILGGASMWSAGANAPRKPATVLAEARSAPAAAVAIGQPPVVAAAPQAVTAVSVVEPAVPATAPEVALAAAPAAEPVATVDDAARAAKAAQARRKAARLAQERALAEETQRLQVAQQSEAERVQQQLAEQARQRAAAEQARLQSVQLALVTRRSVGESCSAAGGPISRQFCRARECAKAEHQGDPVCVNLREEELAQQRASNNR